MIISLHYKCCI